VAYITPKQFLEQRLTMIETELDRLGVPHLLPLVQRITRNFCNFPFDLDMEPAQQLLGKLRDLPAPANPRRIYNLIARLDAFSYRAFVQLTELQTPSYWNPLEIAYDEFFPTHRKVVVQSEHEYPASDIIIHYCECMEPGFPHA
jgi:hypothetical protein